MIEQEQALLKHLAEHRAKSFPNEIIEYSLVDIGAERLQLVVNYKGEKVGVRKDGFWAALNMMELPDLAEPGSLEKLEDFVMDCLKPGSD